MILSAFVPFHISVVFRGRAPCRQHSSIGPTSLSCALRNLVYDCEKRRLASHIFIFLKCFHHFKSCKVIFSGISDHFARFEITKIRLCLAVQQRFRLSLFVLHQPPSYKYRLILTGSCHISAMTHLNLTHASLCSWPFFFYQGHVCCLPRKQFG